MELSPQLLVEIETDKVMGSLFGEKYKVGVYEIEEVKIGDKGVSLSVRLRGGVSFNPSTPGHKRWKKERVDLPPDSLLIVRTPEGCFDHELDEICDAVNALEYPSMVISKDIDVKTMSKGELINWRDEINLMLGEMS